MKKVLAAILLVMSLLTAGCGVKAEEPSAAELAMKDFADAAEYIAAVSEASDLIKKSLEEDVLTQGEMNEKAEALHKLWDDAMNSLWPELESVLSEEDFAKLQEEQAVWIAEKETSMEEAGKEFEGGSMYPLIVNSEAAALTEARVYQLCDILEVE